MTPRFCQWLTAIAFYRSTLSLNFITSTHDEEPASVALEAALLAYGTFNHRSSAVYLVSHYRVHNFSFWPLYYYYYYHHHHHQEKNTIGCARWQRKNLPWFYFLGSAQSSGFSLRRKGSFEWVGLLLQCGFQSLSFFF